MKPSFAPFDWRTELAAQRRLFSESFPENAGLPSESEAYYHRKFREFPATPPSYEYVAADPEGLVGYYAAIPFTYRVDGHPLRCGMVCDVMTSPRMQGKGVFTKLGAYSLDRLAEAGIDFVTGYPRRPAVLPGHLKVGWQVAFKLPMYLLPLKADAMLGIKGVRWAAPLVNPCLWVLRQLLSALAPGGAHCSTEIVAWKDFVELPDLGGFLKTWAATRRVTLDKSLDFLRWRLSIQEADYRAVLVRREGELCGISIVRACRPEGVASLAVMDLMCLGDEPVVLGLMRRAWLDLARQWKCETVLMMMSEFHAQRLRLWRLGFLRTPAVFSFILKCLNDPARERVPLDPGAWHLMWIDCDDL